VIPIRDENPSRTFPLVTVLLIAVNAGVFIYQATLGQAGQAWVYRFGAIPWEITHFAELPGLAPGLQTGWPNAVTLLSSMFLHGGVFHLAGNMLYLWIFGDNIEGLMGHLRFLFFYLICGLIAAMTYVLFQPNSEVPMIGASGAVSGVLGAYLLRFPGARVHMLVIFFWFIRVIRVPAVLVLGFWFIIQVFNGIGSVRLQEKGGVAWMAHVGGFAAGMLLIYMFSKKRH
jgi:membrane associated rhomboid family serine protease